MSSSPKPATIVITAALLFIAVFFGIYAVTSYFGSDDVSSKAGVAPIPALALPQAKDAPDTGNGSKAGFLGCPPALVGKTPLCR